MKTKRFFPVILVWRDKSLDCEQADRVKIPFVYIRKGRVLTFLNPNETKMEVHIRLSKIQGNIRMKRKPTEMTVDEFRERAQKQ